MLPSDHMFFSLLGALAVGLTVGCVPLFVALKRNQNRLGYALFALCVIAGLIFGGLGSIPVGIVALLVLFLPSRKGAHDEPR